MRRLRSPYQIHWYRGMHVERREITIARWGCFYNSRKHHAPSDEFSIFPKTQKRNDGKHDKVLARNSRKNPEHALWKYEVWLVIWEREPTKTFSLLNRKSNEQNGLTVWGLMRTSASCLRLSLNPIATIRFVAMTTPKPSILCFRSHNTNILTLTKRLNNLVIKIG